LQLDFKPHCDSPANENCDEDNNCCRPFESFGCNVSEYVDGMRLFEKFQLKNGVETTRRSSSVIPFFSVGKNSGLWQQKTSTGTQGILNAKITNLQSNFLPIHS
jgi:hypothetical protein